MEYKQKERTKEDGQWIVASSGPLGPNVATMNARRVERITYSAARPPYVSFNTCHHTRGQATPRSNVRIPVSPVGTGHSISWFGGNVKDVDIRDTSVATDAYSNPSLRVEVLPRDYEASVYDAVLRAYAQARYMPAILQPVIELKDVKQTARSALAFAKWCTSRPSSVRKYMRRGHTLGQVVNDFLRETVRESSNAYLAATFGFMPTVGDVSRIANSIANPSKFVKAKRNIIPKNTVLRAGFECPMDMPPFDMSVRHIVRSYSQRVVTEWGDRLNTTKPLNQLATQLLGSRKWYDVTSITGCVFIKARVDTEVDNSLLNDWNFTQTPGAIPWELVPFSFAVDWFYDIGDQLQRAEKRSNVYRRVRIQDFGTPWVSTRRESFSLSASCKSRSVLTGATGIRGQTNAVKASWLAMVTRVPMKNTVVYEYTRGPWEGHLYRLPGQEFTCPVRPYQVAASLALLAQQLTRLGRN